MRKPADFRSMIQDIANGGEKRGGHSITIVADEQTGAAECKEREGRAEGSKSDSGQEKKKKNKQTKTPPKKKMKKKKPPPPQKKKKKKPPTPQKQKKTPKTKKKKKKKNPQR